MSLAFRDSRSLSIRLCFSLTLLSLSFMWVSFAVKNKQERKASSSRTRSRVVVESFVNHDDDHHHEARITEIDSLNLEDSHETRCVWFAMNRLESLKIIGFFEKRHREITIMLLSKWFCNSFSWTEKSFSCKDHANNMMSVKQETKRNVRIKKNMQL